MEALAYMDNAVSDALDRRSAGMRPTDTDKVAARKAATKVVAGFDIHDDAEERRQLDALIEGRRMTIDAFKADRSAIKAILKAKNVEPLATVPSKVWRAIAKKAGLFILHPDAQSRVAYDGKAWDKLPDAARVGGGRAGLLGLGRVNGGLDEWASRNWGAMLGLLFPDHESGQPDRNSHFAEIVMPTPPADVALTLARVSSMQLHVVAEAEAIAFRQSMSQMRAHQRAEEERRATALAADPIVYVEHGSASAIVAQFGDFPIEKALMDAVIASDDLIPDAPKLTIAAYLDPMDQYQVQMVRAMVQRSAASQASQANQWAQLVGTVGVGGTGGGTGQSMRSGIVNWYDDH